MLLSDRILKCIAPLALHYAVSFLFAALLPGADASLLVLLPGAVCLPVLVYWRMRDRREEDGQREEKGNGGRGIRAVGGTDSLKRTRRRQTKYARLLGWGAACLLLGALLSWFSSWLMESLGLYSRFSNAAQEAFINSPAILLLLGSGIMAPLAEEFVYRGLVYPRLRGCFEMPEQRGIQSGLWPKQTASISMPMSGASILSAVLSSFMFALGHGNLIQFLYAFPMGLVLCALCDRGALGLYPPIMLHLGANLYSVLMALLR